MCHHCGTFIDRAIEKEYCPECGEFLRSRPRPKSEGIENEENMAYEYDEPDEDVDFHDDGSSVEQYEFGEFKDKYA